jgi:hypothetical protein
MKWVFTLTFNNETGMWDYPHPEFQRSNRTVEDALYQQTHLIKLVEVYE